MSAPLVKRHRGLVAVVALLAAATGVVVASSAPAGAVTVADEAALRTAFADPNETEIVLANDIDLVDCTEGDLDRFVGVDPLQPLTIRGQGFTIRQRCDERVIDTEGELTLEDVTITGGNQPNASGGGIHLGDDGTPSLTLRNATVTGNRATGGGSGGGIDASDGEFVLAIDSTLSDNFAGDTGGGIRVAPTTTFVRSTISGNSIEGDTGFGGGIDGDTGTVLLVNSTVVGNTDPGADASAGGIFAEELTAVYSTITQNSGGGTIAAANILGAEVGSVQLFATVIAQPLGGGPNCAFVAAPTTASAGYNFSDDATCALTDPTDVQDGGDPLLGALGANGGPTLTRLPLLGPPVSQLIDAIPAAACGGGDALAGEAVTTDQRGVSRPQAVLGPPACDIGSVEVELPPLVLEPRFTG